MVAWPSKARPGLNRTRASPGTNSGRWRLPSTVCTGFRSAFDRHGQMMATPKTKSTSKDKRSGLARKTRALIDRKLSLELYTSDNFGCAKLAGAASAAKNIAYQMVE